MGLRGSAERTDNKKHGRFCKTTVQVPRSVVNCVVELELGRMIGGQDTAYDGEVLDKNCANGYTRFSKRML